MLKISLARGTALSNEKSAENMRYIKEIGFDGIDYGSFAAEPGTGIFSLTDSEFESYLKTDAEFARSIGLDINMAHGPWPFDDINKDLKDIKFEAFVKSIKGSAILGAEYVIFHPLMPSGWDKSPHHEEDIQANIEFTRSLLPYAKEYNVKIALENMPCSNMPAGTVKELVDTIDAVDSEYCVACLDTGHANYLKMDSGEAVLMLGDRLKCLHIHDNNGQSDSHCMPYTQSINWQSFIDALKKINYKGYVNFEVQHFRGPEDMRRDYDELLVKIAKHFAKAISE